MLFKKKSKLNVLTMKSESFFKTGSYCDVSDLTSKTKHILK